jgi:hypothetical protein
MAIIASQGVLGILSRAMPGQKRVDMITGCKIATRGRTIRRTNSEQIALSLDATTISILLAAGSMFILETSIAVFSAAGNQRGLEKVDLGVRIGSMAFMLRKKRLDSSQFRPHYDECV